MQRAIQERSRRLALWRQNMPETLESWGSLALLEASAAQEAMVARFCRLASKGDSERTAELRTMITEEYALNADQLHSFTANRLRSLLQLSPADANTIANDYNCVFDSLPSELAMRRASVVQSVARLMTPDEVTSLRALIPSLLTQIPAGKSMPQDRPAEAAATPPSSPKPHPAWMFWRGRGGKS